VFDLFGVIILYMCEEGVQFHSLHEDIGTQHHLLDDYFPIELMALFSSIDSTCQSLFLAFQFCCIDLYLSLCHYHTVLVI
jgi:hypothetical protein